MSERVEYAEIIVEAACFYLDHPDMNDVDLTALWEEELLNPVGYSLEDTDRLAAKFAGDDVLDELIAEGTKSECGDGTAVDLSKWDGFKMYAR